MNDISSEIRNRLFELRDNDYKNFHTKLMPGIDPDTVIGVRTPDIKSFAKELSKNENVDDFLNDIPHKYYDENNLHGFIICHEKDYDLTVEKLNLFLPQVNNWATCDLLKPASFKKKNNRQRLLDYIKELIKSDHVYTKRFGIGMLMAHFLDEDFSPEYPEMIAQINCDEYYIMMMCAWYFATALAKQYDAVVPFIENRALDKRTHNKAIQKAVESYRITDEQKAYLKSLKIQ